MKVNQILENEWDNDPVPFVSQKSAERQIDAATFEMQLIRDQLGKWVRHAPSVFKFWSIPEAREWRRNNPRKLPHIDGFETIPYLTGGRDSDPKRAMAYYFVSSGRPEIVRKVQAMMDKQVLLANKILDLQDIVHPTD